jgi:hypothetical protein
MGGCQCAGDHPGHPFQRAKRSKKDHGGLRQNRKHEAPRSPWPQPSISKSQSVTIPELGRRDS